MATETLVEMGDDIGLFTAKPIKLIAVNLAPAMMSVNIICDKVPIVWMR